MSVMELLKTAFPRTKATKHSAFCERIPMVIFEVVEQELRKEMREKGYIARYRGPRVSNNVRFNPTTTMRCDATHVLLYKK